jgi:hypothetical protein
MKKNPTYILLLAFSVLSQADAQKINRFSIYIGQATFTSLNTPYSERLIYPNGASIRTISDIRGMKGLSLTAGYERQIYKRISATMNLTGIRIKSSGINIFDDLFVNGEPFEAEFPYKRDLWAGILQAQLLYDFLRDEDMDLTFGAGPSATFSRFRYPSYTTLILHDDGQTSFSDLSTTTRQSTGLGYSFSMGFGVALPKSLFLRVQILHHRLESVRYTMVELGTGIQRFGGNKIP